MNEWPRQESLPMRRKPAGWRRDKAEHPSFVGESGLGIVWYQGVYWHVHILFFGWTLHFKRRRAP